MLQYSRAYDNSGLITGTSSTTPAGSPNQTYGYDAIKRLSTKTQNSTSAPIAYNDANALTQASNSTSYAYSSATQRVSTNTLGTRTVNYGYDSRGNRTSATESISGSTTSYAGYAYNAQNQLTSASTAISSTATPTTTSNYTYNGDGLRTKKVTTGTGAGSEDYAWNSNTSVPTLLEDATYAYIYGDSSTPIAQVNKSTHAVKYLHADLLGSVRAVTTASGVLAQEYDYDEYGNAVGTDKTHTVSKFGYAGEYFDADLGFYYLRARWYDPSTAQFTSVDPVMSKTHAAYSYADSNPIGEKDPLGLYTKGGCISYAFGFAIGTTKQFCTQLAIDDSTGEVEFGFNSTEGSVSPEALTQQPLFTPNPKLFTPTISASLTAQTSTARNLDQLDKGFDTYGVGASVPGLPVGLTGTYFHGPYADASICDSTLLPDDEVLGGEVGVSVGEPSVNYYHLDTYTTHNTVYKGDLNNPISWVYLALFG